MQNKISITGIPARDAALKGVSYVASAVKSTIGPFGQNALIEKGEKSTNDGYLIATELLGTIKNEFERRGARVAHEASSKTNDEVGDCTSGAWVLTEAIIKESLRYLPSEKSLISKKTPAEIGNMIDAARVEVLSKLKDSVKKIESKEELIKSALVSVEDKELSEILGSTQWDLGENGRIITEEVNETTSSIEVVPGLRIDNGFSNSTIINNPEKGSFEISDSAIILTNYTIGVEEIKLLQQSLFSHILAQKQTKLIIMARAFTSEAIQLCVTMGQAGFGVFPINAPYTDQAERMRDIQAIVGGRYIDSEEGALSDIYITDVGYVKSLVARRFDATIGGIEDEISKKRIHDRVEVLTGKLKASQSDYERNTLHERVAQFTNGFAILKVGSSSITERKRLKDKCDDAVNAVRLALKGGTVKGAGIAFKEISDKLDEENILKRPIRVIYDQIISSAPSEFVIQEWVRDPYLVLESALTNACNTAKVLVRTGIVIANENPPKKKYNEDLED